MTEPARPTDPLFLQARAIKIAVVCCAVVLVGFALWALKRFLEPFILAIFLLLMIDGMARAIIKRAPRLSELAATAIAVVFIVALFGFTIWLTVGNAGDFAAHLPEYTFKLDLMLEDVSARLGLSTTPTSDQLIRQFNPGRYAGAIGKALRNGSEASVLTLIYLGFLLASRRGFEAKAREIFGTSTRRQEANRVFDRIRNGVESYIWVQTVVGAMIAAGSAIVMWAVGLSHIGFWALIIFLANYIPAIGGAIGVLFPAVFGLVELEGWWRAVVLVVAMEAIHFVVNHVVQPRMQGKSLNVDPLVVLLALAFWGALWG